MNKNTNNTVFSLINTDRGVIINNNVYSPIRVNNIDALYDKHDNTIYNSNSNVFYANGFIINNDTDKQVLLGDGSTTGELIKQISINNTIDGYRIIVKSINGDTEDIMLSGANGKVVGLMTAPDKVKLDS